MALNPYRTIVVGTDGSALADPTVSRAALLAKQEDADLIVVCAYSSLPRRDAAKDSATLGGETAFGQVPGRTAANEALRAAAELATEVGRGPRATLLVDGEPAEALLHTAEVEQADLIVLGATSRPSLAQRILGVVATEVLNKARCEVLIVRPPAGEREFEVPEDGAAPAASDVD